MGVESNLIPLSEATLSLEQSMYGSLSRPQLVVEAKQKFKRSSIGKGHWRRMALAAIAKAVRHGKLRLFASPSIDSVDRTFEVPRSVFALVIGQNSLFDHVHFIAGGKELKKLSPNHQTIATKLPGCALYLLREQFLEWKQNEKAKGKWPTQFGKTKSQKSKGRPRSEWPKWHNLIDQAVNGNKWNLDAGIPALRKFLQSQHADVPSEDTLRRIVKHYVHLT